ncbi:Alpha/Beta hydrolase protein [Sporodiniella umbellata]|nr:Alpha/Beta hydrolase protein [Sporodiniella umbellata]
MFIVSPKDWAETKGSIFVRSLGLEKEGLLEDLQSIDVETFLESQTFMTTWPNFLEGLAPVGNSVDHHRLHQTVIEHFFHQPLPAGYEHLEVMIGYTRDEFNFFFPFLPNFQDMDDSMFVRTYFTHIFGHKNSRKAYEIYKQQIVPPMSPPSEVARYMCSDVMCRISTMMLADNLSKRGHNVYLYQWDYESNDVQNVIKAAHMVDSIFSWDNLVYWTDNPFLGPGDDYERDRVAKQISKSIIEFARSGNPNHDALPTWPLHKPEERCSLIFDAEVRVEKEIYQTGFQLWKSTLKDYVHNPSFPILPKQPSQHDQSNLKKRRLEEESIA